MLSSEFHCKENDGFRIVPVHPGLRRHAGFHKPGTRLHEHHNHWRRVLGVQVRPGNNHFLYNENQTTALNTTLLKCCLPSTGAMKGRKKFTHAYDGSRLLHASVLHWNSPGFCKQTKIRSDTFLTEWYIGKTLQLDFLIYF